MASESTNADHEDTHLPSWLSSHLKIDWTSDDVDALLESIDASQSPQPPRLPHLPAEILMLIIEFVPISYVLDWRLVCRGFHDAIGGPILYRHLQRTQLVGYLGPRSSSIVRRLNETEYEKLHLVYTDFHRLKAGEELVNVESEKKCGPIWSSPYAEFTMNSHWRNRHQTSKRQNTALPSRNSLLNQLDPDRARHGFGTLVWAIKLDAAVLDLHLPLDLEHRTFGVSVELDPVSALVTVSVEWKPMLFLFIKTETALRRLMEKRAKPEVTFSLVEDALRAVRRQRLHAALDPENRIDRHIKWSLRLLRPLWGCAGRGDFSTLDPIEADAARVLLLMRRTATLNQREIQHLRQLSLEYARMMKEMSTLSQDFKMLKTFLVLPGHDDLAYSYVPAEQRDAQKLPLNPIAWSNELLATIEKRVQRWKAQESVIAQIQALMVASREIRKMPEDAFDVMDSDF